MNLTKAKILLDKINRLYKSMSLDEENVASIEKDLMQDYIKQFYETFLDENKVVATPKKTYSAPKPAYTPPPVRKKVVVSKPPPPPPPPVVVEEVPIVKVVPETKVVASPPPPPLPIVESQPAASSTPKTRTTKSTSIINPVHADLFSLNLEAKELSEKLGQSRIDDLNNAMGLNERIFTINELFGADNSLYRNVIKDLNELKNFEQAKAYLSTNIAEKYNWTSKSKRNKAKIFIKLVRRRYL